MVKYQRVDIYGMTVLFLANPTKVEFELMYHDNVEKITDDEYKLMYKDTFNNNGCGGFTTLLECGDIVCCIKEVGNEGYVAHEILHTTNRILGSRGVILDADNDEPQTYLCGWLTKVFYDALKEKKE